MSRAETNPQIKGTAQSQSTKPKIAFVLHPFWGSPDTVSTHIAVHEVARRLTNTFSTVVYKGRGAEPAAVGILDGIHYRYIKVPSENQYVRLLGKMPGLRKFRGSISFKSSWYYWGLALQIALDVKAQGCDIVHILNLSQFAPIIRAINPKTKIVLHMHSEWLTRLNPSSIRRRLKKVDFVFSCSDFVTKQIREAFPDFAGRCATVYNGVEVQRFFPSGEPREAERIKRLLFVGAVCPHKGLHVLLDALPAVVKRYPKFRLDIVGESAFPLPLDWLPSLGEPELMEPLVRFYDGKGYVGHLEEQIARLDLKDYVQFVGKVSRDDLMRRYRQADLFVFPSLWNELFGMPTAEANSCGVPVVTSRIAGLPEVVEHEKTGLLVPPGDPTALADAIIRLLEDEELRRSMGQAGRERVLQHFTWDKIVQDLVPHYEALMAGDKSCAMETSIIHSKS
jgi:glycosyltransferase involved in cell wall biosynthesis